MHACKDIVYGESQMKQFAMAECDKIGPVHTVSWRIVMIKVPLDVDPESSYHLQRKRPSDKIWVEEACQIIRACADHFGGFLRRTLRWRPNRVSEEVSCVDSLAFMFVQDVAIDNIAELTGKLEQTCGDLETNSHGIAHDFHVKVFRVTLFGPYFVMVISQCDWCSR